MTAAKLHDDPSLPDFSNNCVSLHLALDRGVTRIVNPRWDTIGGRLVLRGRHAEEPDTSNWLSGIEACVAWDAVIGFVLFDSEEDLLRRRGVLERYKASPGGRLN